MKKRSEKITFFKVKDEGKHGITVLKAISTENEIRFYLNDTQYIKATDGGDGIIVEWDEEIQKKDIKKKKSLLEDVKNNKKDYLLILAMSVLFLVLDILIQIAINGLMENVIISSFWFSFSLPMYILIMIGFLEYKKTPLSLKSKHSAEHMIVNFLEKNSRLPKNFQEIKSASRFSKYCGNRFEAIELVHIVMRDVISVSLSIFIETLIVKIFFQDIEDVNVVLLIVVFVIISYGVHFANFKLVEKGRYKLIIQGLNYFLQCFKTTRKVNDKDILLAFYAAKFWMLIVYPEFYTDSKLYCEKDESENV